MICVAPRASGFDTLIDGFTEASLAKVEEIVQRNFGFYLSHRDRSSKLTRRVAFDRRIIRSDSREHLFIRVIGRRFEDAKKVSDKTIAPASKLTRGPDHPDLISPAPDC